MENAKIYIGTKIVKGTPMTRDQFNASRGMAPLIEQEDQAGYLVEYEDGYTSWSPLATFERAYRELTPAERVLIVSP